MVHTLGQTKDEEHTAPRDQSLKGTDNLKVTGANKQRAKDACHVHAQRREGSRDEINCLTAHTRHSLIQNSRIPAQLPV